MTEGLEATHNAINHLHDDFDSSKTSTADMIGRLKLMTKAIGLQLDLVAYRLQMAEIGIDNLLEALVDKRHHSWLAYWITTSVIMGIFCITCLTIAMCWNRA